MTRKEDRKEITDPAATWWAPYDGGGGRHLLEVWVTWTCIRKYKFSAVKMAALWHKGEQSAE